MNFTPEQLENWKSYEDVRYDGQYNMFDRRAEEATGLTHDEYMFVMKNYTELAKAVNLPAGWTRMEDGRIKPPNGFTATAYGEK